MAAASEAIGHRIRGFRTHGHQVRLCIQCLCSLQTDSSSRHWSIGRWQIIRLERGCGGRHYWLWVWLCGHRCRTWGRISWLLTRGDDVAGMLFGINKLKPWHWCLCWHSSELWRLRTCLFTRLLVWVLVCGQWPRLRQKKKRNPGYFTSFNPTWRR